MRSVRPLTASALGATMVLTTLLGTTTTLPAAASPALPLAAPAAVSWPAVAGYHPIPPRVVLDSRTGVGVSRGSLPVARLNDIVVTGVGSGAAAVPFGGVEAVVLEVTGIGPAPTAAAGNPRARTGGLVVYPSGGVRPAQNQLRVPPTSKALPAGVTTTVLVHPGTGRRVSVVAAIVALHARVRVLGWFAVGGHLASLPQTALFSSLTGLNTPLGELSPGRPRIVTVAGRAGLPPSGLGQVVLAVSAIGVSRSGTVFVHPTGSSTTKGAHLTFVKGRTTHALVVVAPNAGGQISVTVTGGPMHVSAEVQGWVTRPGGSVGANHISRVSTTSTGAAIDAQLTRPSLTADGRFVTFSGIVGVGGGYEQRLYRKDTTTGATEVLAAGQHSKATLTPDGRFVGYDLIAGSTLHVSVKDLVTSTVSAVDLTPGATLSSGDAWFEDLSDDGNLVLFSSAATDLVPGVGDGTAGYLYLRDRQAATTVAIGRCGADGLCPDAVMTPDGAHVLYTDAGATSTTVHRWTRAGATDLLVNSDGFAADITDDGNLVVLAAATVDGATTPSGFHGYLKNLTTGSLTLLDRSAAGSPANADVGDLVISGDGHRVALSTKAGNLLAPHGAGALNQLYLKDLATGAVRLVSRTPSGWAGNGDTDTSADPGSILPRLNTTGTKVAFHSQSTDLVAGVNTWYDTYLADLA